MPSDGHVVIESESPSRLRAGHGRVSRADALRAYFELGPERIAGPVGALGFRWQPPKTPEPEPPAERQSASAATVSPAPARARPVQPAEPLACWRPVRRSYVAKAENNETIPDSEAVRPFEAEELGATGPPPPSPPIVAEPRLRRRLDAELRTPRASRTVDVDRLTTTLARGESLRELPLRPALTQARLVLVLDPSSRLIPFWQDQVDLAVALVRRLGPGQVRRLPPPGASGSAAPVTVADDEIVLAVSDLGFFGGAEARRRWVRYGRRLRAAGARYRALVPCPAWRWRGPGAALWNAIDWSAPEGVGRRRRPTRVADAPVPEAVDVLLRLLAPAVRIEPGLLRSLRRRLGAAADLGTEADVWNHPEVDGSSSRSLELPPRLRLELTEQPLSEGWAAELVADAAQILLGWHAERENVVWAIEVAHLLACGVTDEAIGLERIAEAEQVLSRAAATAMSSEAGHQRLAGAAGGFWTREGPRAPAGLTTEQRFGRLWVDVTRFLRQQNPDAPLPAGVTPDMLQRSEAEPELPLKIYSVRQAVEGWLIGLRETATRGSLIIEISARQPEVFIEVGPRAPVRVELKNEGCELPGPTVSGTVVLTTDVERVEIAAVTQPVWASSFGRDGYGLWASFEVAGVEQRMRWMSPGRLMMGSPETEAGRWAAEGPVHEVELTEGCWLAETPCTQALWDTVMDTNPSRFRSPDRPVEKVSWDDCQRFFDRLCFRVRDLELVLPSEAEWEYACRAGTETATWAGDLEILGDRNAPLLDEIAWYGGNSGVNFDLVGGVDSSKWPEKQHPHTRAGTRGVGVKLANSWGVHDMLGNVYEWCWDGWERYNAGAAIDPEGATDGAYRVVRGGSWGDHARAVRAAYRDGDGPGDRSHSLGFRLSRGPKERGALVNEGKSAVSKADRRGTSRRARSRRARSRRDLAWVDRLGWAVDGGLDGHGRWAAFEVEGVVHRMRWIYPGNFMMGSPETEEGRFEDEGPRHEVTLTQGFWLGEVPCTQALWQVVTGEQPSRFKSPRRPVEQVSWEDCQEFFELLRARVPGFDVRLPTEAQWEYACRAGTETATWAGDLEILGERNAPRLDPIAWYGGNSGVDFDLSNGVDSSDWGEKQHPHAQAGTREVGLKQANPWGLHDMLGNVLEWCEDRWDYGTAYPGGSRVDPVGTDGAFRVIRGGSWDVHARDVRAASRHGYVPGFRYHFLGFRLSRGPQDWAEPNEEQEVQGPPAEGRGVRRAPER